VPPAISATLIDRGGSGRQALRLLIFGRDGLGTHPLPDRGELVLGRDPEAQVQVDLPSISRRHARLVLGDRIELEDLGSSNGSKVRGKPLPRGERAVLEPGEPFELGSVTFVVQRYGASAQAPRPRRLMQHVYFESRLEEECERAGRTGSPFALLRVRLAAPSLDGSAEEAIAQVLGPGDIVALYGPGDYEALLFDCPPDRAAEAARVAMLKLAEKRLKSRTAAACFPRDGRAPEVLAGRVAEALRGGEEAPSRAGGEPPVVVLDPAVQRIHGLVKRVAQSPISVLFMGETGVGKEIFAAALHRSSPRAKAPFLSINCGALSETLLEGELFGYEKGAFTGAIKAKPGLLESASGGTVFLDEVGEMPPPLQVKLLRVLEQRQVRRLGALEDRKIDVRFVAATNRDLEAEVKKGTFREDLFFRLNGINFTIPPLRERRAEIPELARAFAAHASALAGRGAPGFSPEAMALLERYRWPGNIRELRNVVERAVALCEELIEEEHLPVERMAAPVFGDRGDAPRTAPSGEDPERTRILEALDRCAGNQTAAAKMLGMTRRVLMARLDAHGIARPRKAVREETES
jgi:DNA-binding NtrC family response regulator